MSQTIINDENFREYLNLIQNIITRLAQNSFRIKTWYPAIFSAVIIVSFAYPDYFIKAIIHSMLIIILIAFWYLDSYYLKQERLFRQLYNKKVDEYNDEVARNSIKIFDMNVKMFLEKEQKIPRIMFSISEIGFYSPFLIILVVLLIIQIILI
jgi:hypothetical protein